MAEPARFTARIAGLRQALVLGFDYRVLLLWVLGTLVPALIAALPIWRSLAYALDLSPLSPDIARHFDALVFADLTSRFRALRPAHEAAVGVAAACFVLISPLLSAAMLATAEGGRQNGFVPLLQRALAWYGRSFRLWLVTLLPVGALLAISGWLSKTASGYGERATLESRASLAGHAALAVTLVLVALLHVTVEAGRAELIASPQRRSVLWAWLTGARKAMARPLATLALYWAPSVLSFAVAAVLLAVRVHAIGVSWLGFGLGALFTQLAVAAIGWGHLSRLIALSNLFRAHVDRR
ncbi:MAG: hypothetical protein ABUL62_20350 [Myxococcales bacterium]